MCLQRKESLPRNWWNLTTVIQFNPFPHFGLQFLETMYKNTQTQRCNQMFSFTSQLGKLKWKVLCREFISLVNFPLQKAVKVIVTSLQLIVTYQKHIIIFYDTLHLLTGL